MYKAILSGSAAGRSGSLYRFSAGQTIEAPKGELDHCKSVIWIGKVKTTDPNEKPLKGTVKQIRDWLDAHNIEYPARANKAELIETLENA
jgi:hypothetical protein